MGNRVSSDSSAPAPPAAQAYNVYNQPIDPSNQMPVTPNQLPWPGQQKLLSTERATSTIPKGGGGQWVFPSPQMFYSALMRKGKGSDVTEDDMESVITVHNGMNELTWEQVLRWERLHRAECATPRLLRFLGRPDELSPRARVRQLLTGTAPFDRHDWYVDRCGRPVRYVIDFYFDESKAGSMDAFELDVRPALDDWSSLLDRAKMGVHVLCTRYNIPCPITSMNPPSTPSTRE